MTHRLKIREVRERSRGVLEIRGPLAAGSGTREILRRVRCLLNRGIRRVVIDLAGVPFVDCAGIGMLILCLKEARGRGGELRVRHCRGPLRRMLELSALLEPLQGGEPAVGLASWNNGRDVLPLLPA
ncbi:MAG: STAS domain-containing protein [Acidobacteria bacterium]|nr:STAS domain-containing protein [Acidobacteriota bacterium]